MIRKGSVIAATVALFATAVFAQGNVPQGQSLCSMGYMKASNGGMLSKVSKEGMKMADKNNDGKLSKSEFDNACANRLFKEQEKGS
jgi:hypothetical protein